MMRRMVCVTCAAVLILQVPSLADQGPAKMAAPGVRPAAAPGATATATAPTGPAPKARIDEKVYDFGEIWEGTKVEHDFIVANDGEGILDVISVRASCGCTASQSDPKLIEPGKKGKIHVTFNTSGKGTTPKTSVSVQTNDPANARFDLRMEGKAKTKIEITPRSGISFGRVIDNTAKPITVKMVSNLPKPFKPEVQPLQAHKDLFKVTLAELQPNKEYELTVAPQPPFPEGSTAASLDIKTGIEDMPTINIPINMFVPPAVEVTPGLIALGAPPARELPYRIDITFNASGQMQLLSATSTDPAIKTSILEEAPGRRYRVLCQIPAGYNILNDQKVEIKIETDYAPKKEISVPVTMRVVPPRPGQPTSPTRPAAAAPPSDKPSLDMSVMSLDVGSHKPDEPVAQEIYFRNGGGKPLEISRVTGSPGVTIDLAYAKTVAPGAAGMITARFPAPKKPGPFAQKVTIESNDATRPSIPVSITGVTRSYIEVVPASGVDFSRRRESHALPHPVRLTYNGEGHIKYLKADCNTPKFEVLLEQIGDTAIAKLMVSAKPPFDPGVNAGVIRVTTDSQLQPVVEVPVTLTMPPQIELDPAQLVFVKNVARVQKKALTVYNYGVKPLNILAVERSSPKLQTQFFPDQDGLSYQLHVTVPESFEPAAQGEKVVIRTDDPDFKELVVPLVFKTMDELRAR